jgi:uridine kinase
VGRRVIVLAGPSGAGKSRLADRLALPVLRLDDFYRDGDEPGLPQLDMGVTDWDDPRSWNRDAAVAAAERLCRDGVAQVPRYSIPHNRRMGTRTLDVRACAFFVAEGIFAPEIVPELRARGLLGDAVCVRHHRLVTFWRRLSRDLRERRKPWLVLVLRGLLLLRTEPTVVRRATTAGCVPLTPPRAERRLRRLLA